MVQGISATGDAGSRVSSIIIKSQDKELK